MTEIRYKTFVYGDEPDSDIVATASGRKRKYPVSRRFYDLILQNLFQNPGMLQVIILWERFIKLRPRDIVLWELDIIFRDRFIELMPQDNIMFIILWKLGIKLRPQFILSNESGCFILIVLEASGHPVGRQIVFFIVKWSLLSAVESFVFDIHMCH